MATVVGNDGHATLPSGYNMNIKTWAATISRVSSDVTGFGNTGRARRLGILDITGSLGGTPFVSVAGDPFGLTGGTGDPAAQAGGTISLHVLGTSTATTYATGQAMVQFGAVFNSWAFNVDKTGESTITMNFEMNDTNGGTIVWATT